MKFRRRRIQLLLLILPAITPVIARSLQTDSSTLRIRDAVPVEAQGAKANPVGTKDAPVDGKDGKPHAGPFVETEAERARKKAKESGEEKPLKDISSSVKGQYSTEGELPKSNEGVMDDPHRVGPKEGTRGTEGGVTEKSKDSKIGEEKKPDPPKELPPLPHSEEQKIKATPGKDGKVDEDGKGLLEVCAPSRLESSMLNVFFFQKPQDLPDKPHDIPIPENPSSPKAPIDFGDEKPGFKSATANSHNPQEVSGVISPLHSLILSFTMILFSEVGDKTFLVAALMAMRHPRMVVFTAAFSALITMTVLSAVLGHAVPTLIPKSVTNFLAAGLFLVFGLKMLLEARKISPDEGVSEEMKEVEMELEEKELQQRRKGRRKSSSVTPYVLEAGRGVRAKSKSRLPSPPESPSSTSSRDSSPSRHSSFKQALDGINNLLSLLLSPAWVQTFVMTFLGEWGDRSQIATIAMAAGQDYWWVTGGALCGHAICTGAAVIGGRAIAGKVSLRTGKTCQHATYVNDIRLMIDFFSDHGRSFCLPSIRRHLSLRGDILNQKRRCLSLAPSAYYNYVLDFGYRGSGKSGISVRRGCSTGSSKPVRRAGRGFSQWMYWTTRQTNRQKLFLKKGDTPERMKQVQANERRKSFVTLISSTYRKKCMQRSQ